MTQNDSVHELVNQVVRGDAQGAAWLFDTFAERLFRRLRARYEYPGGIDADDLLQDAFVFYLQNDAKVLRDFLSRVPERQQTQDRLERHLWDLACGVASNRRRSLKRKKDEPLPDDQWLDDPRASPDSELTSRQELEALNGCVEGSGSRIFLYYKLRFFDGHSPSEIAEMTDWSMKTTYRLRQRLNDALHACAEKLGIAR